MSRLLLLLLSALGGIFCGEALWRGAVRARSSEAPPEWSREQATVPYQLAELSGDLPFDAAHWSLDFYRALSWTGEAGQRISASARLPAEGRLELWPAAPQRRPATGLILSRVGEPSTTVITRSGGVDQVARCADPLPAPGDAVVPVAIGPAPGGGLTVLVGEVSTRCEGRPGDGAPQLRPGLRRVQVADVTVGEQRTPGPGPGGRPLWWLLGGLAIAVVVLLELRVGARLALVALTTAPLLLALLLAPRDMQPWVQAMRAPWLPPAWMAGGIPLALSAVAKIHHHLGRQLIDQGRSGAWWWGAVAIVPAALALATVDRGLPGALAAGLAIAGGAGLAAASSRLLGALGSAEPGRAGAIILGTGSACGLGLSLMGPLHQIAVLLFFAAGALWTLLLWANANARRVRAFNPLSLVAFTAAIVCLEMGIRYTPAGIAWSGGGARTQLDDMYGWVDVANQDFALIEQGEHTTYPDRGFPVAIPDDQGQLRIVAMGGSTTGGAYQNDDLAEFYPARLAERLGPGYQVINQGVGGWTTWHIQHYLAEHIDALRPDVLTLYVGHNDLLTPVPMPYAELYTAWKRTGGVKRTSTALNRVRLYQAMRGFLTSLTPARQRVAVPVEDAEENLAASIALVTGRGGKVLLASEGLAPDPGPMVEYNALMERLADENPAVHYVDTAAALHRLPSGEVFLDDCHLTDSGHRLVAELLSEALAEMKVLNVDPQ